MSLRQRLHSLGAYPRTEFEGCRKPLYFLGSSVEWLSGEKNSDWIDSLIGPTAESAGKRMRGRKSSAFDLSSSFGLANPVLSFCSFKSFSSFSICYRSNSLSV